ncbi:M48 family metalloprotease [Piscinibacter sp.]|uniref:M48 family metalloprotease n=1 Tax=Piscinibacter sp. TaxID=1903157 RepID=UPI002F3EF505
MRFRRHQEAAQDSTRRLLGLFSLVLLGLMLAVNAALALIYRITFPFASGYPSLFFETNTAIVLLFVLGGCWFETLRLREGGAHVARLAGGRPVQVSGHSASNRLERRFANIVQELALASRIQAPAAWVLPRDDAINAFAAGWAPEDAVIAVTRGALERLTREELQGVVAHEFSHIAHGDTRLNMRLIGLVWGLQMVFGFGLTLAQPDENGRRPAGMLFGFALMAVGALGWAAGRLLQAAVSRQREFLADASAVEYTRLVAGLGGALRKIADQAQRRMDRLQTVHAASLSHLVFSVPGGSHLWSTHPPLAERLHRLYGRDVEPLAAKVLPAPSVDEPLMALAPRMPASSVPDAAPEAERHDATQIPAWHGRAAREAEALDRIARWHGPGERYAALLALLVEPGDTAGWTAWSRSTAHLPLADSVRGEIDALGPPSRMQVFETLARRSAAAPTAELLALLRAARAQRAGASSRLRWLALRRLLRALPARLPTPEPADSLAALWPQVVAATACLALAMRLGPQDTAGWQTSALRALRSDAASPPPSAASAAAALQLRRLSAMQRPQLVCAWVEAMPSARLDDPRVCDALQMACWLLDTPLPPALAQRRPSAQLRSL